MLRFRTKLLLAGMFVFGLGIGVFASFADGLYSAICLFVLPLLVALAGASIIADFSQPIASVKPAPVTVSAKSPTQADFARFGTARL